MIKEEVSEQIVVEIDSQNLPEYEENKSEIKFEENGKRCKNPEKYTEIYESYTKKEYEKCIAIINDVSEHHVEYEILKSACWINLGKNYPEAHRILDELLEEDSENAFTIYAKGLAYFHEEMWEQSIEYFSKARKLDESADMDRAEVMLEKAQAKLNLLERETTPETKGSQGSLKRTESLIKYRRSFGGTNNSRRFGCEICNHFFGKKFNLDRHNRSLHKRATPLNFPRKSTSTVSKIKQEIKHETTETENIKVTNKLKFRSFNRPGKSSATMKKGWAKCNVCKKAYKKSSLARHLIIHSGKKPHKCDQCPMAFFQKSDLSRHETTHSDEMNFECELCDKKFRIKKNLQVHKKRHHPESL
ncbi:CLUMA_CG007377, isoform A [Clunio marinus]|uniref:CLUMA_CG007377, isoform A n=1 Tax=Clunio marinus TaxID=568069 RepID=A0A1J1I258_9DIPT|nr:CLUMA_CG007377, isoform A [Clunio marinus]